MDDRNEEWLKRRPSNPVPLAALIGGLFGALLMFLVVYSSIDVPRDSTQQDATAVAAIFGVFGFVVGSGIGALIGWVRVRRDSKPHWARDPTGRHALRYWNGTAWTEHVSDSGTRGTDAP